MAHVDTEDRSIKHLIWTGPGASLCPAKQYSSYRIYGVSSVQVAEKLLGHTCHLIHPLAAAPHCLRAAPQRPALSMQVHTRTRP